MAETAELASYRLGGRWYPIRDWDDVRTALTRAEAIRLPEGL